LSPALQHTKAQLQNTGSARLHDLLKEHSSEAGMVRMMRMVKLRMDGVIKCALTIKYQTKPVSVAFAQGWSRFHAQQRQVMVPGK
jgi:hypothetical protein